MNYQAYMTPQEFEDFEMDMERLYEDPSFKFENINRILRELANEQLLDHTKVL